ncbi:hypothetical protein [Guptibacillus hwajinpoensis]|uniref:Adenylate kinase family enzyme n=1 Tax=Guptibacillus hwajinpoensis TaxID=208199 RepID=A0ABU0K3L6_9BACL|nr:hypothetical protein [Alkalihalobacillus hemicentroti]MDQ0483949.1 adenylate kinase family enzyme [Alkalihalobacillus hemicentroti]
MAETKLIIVEGMWGSGKSTTAKLIYDHLTKAGIETRAYLEGDLNNPADYDKVACFTQEEYSELVEKHIDSLKLIEEITQCKGNYYFIEYGKLQQELTHGLPKELLADVMHNDIYDGNLPLERYCEVHLNRWSEFVQEHKKEDSVIVFECCFLQNPLSAMLGRYDASEEMISNYVLKLADLIKPLNSSLLYFHPGDVRSILNRAFHERSSEWRDGVTQYYTQQGYGRSHGLKGFNGLVEFLKVRTEIELNIIDDLLVKKSVIRNDDFNWERVQQEVIQFVEDSFEG